VNLLERALLAGRCFAASRCGPQKKAGIARDSLLERNPCRSADFPVRS
jgi:hypothetical protein